MKLSSFSLCLALVPAAVFGASSAPSAAGTVVVGPEYSANKGLYVPQDTRDSIGLKLVDVDEQQLAASFDFSLYVYSQHGQGASASGRIPAAHAEALKAGQSITVRKSGGDLVGRLTRIEPARSKSGMAEVVVELPAGEGVAVGAFLQANVTESSPQTSASVPRSALVRSTEGYFVYTASGDHFVRTPVTVGALSSDRAMIKEGLFAGDRIVAEPVMSLWMTELAAIKGGHACCAVPAEGK